MRRLYHPQAACLCWYEPRSARAPAVHLTCVSAHVLVVTFRGSMCAFVRACMCAGDGADLPCWGWYLDKTAGPLLRFGAHDMFPTQSDITMASPRQLDLGLDPPKPLTVSKFSLLTLIVNATHVTFYENLKHIGQATMPRPLTDCFNNFDGVLLGSAGLTISQLRFYPFALTPANIEEIIVFGARLSDISTGSAPYQAGDDASEAAQRTLVASIKGVSVAVDDSQNQLEVSQIAQRVDAQAADMYASPTMPIGTAPRAHHHAHASAAGPCAGGAERNLPPHKFITSRVHFYAVNRRAPERELERKHLDTQGEERLCGSSLILPAADGTLQAERDGGR